MNCLIGAIKLRIKNRGSKIICIKKPGKVPHFVVRLENGEVWHRRSLDGNAKYCCQYFIHKGSYEKSDKYSIL